VLDDPILMTYPAWNLRGLISFPQGSTPSVQETLSLPLPSATSLARVSAASLYRPFLRLTIEWTAAWERGEADHVRFLLL